MNQVKEAEVQNMENRLFAGDHSLNAKINNEANAEWIDTIVDNSETQDTILEKNDEFSYRKKLFKKALEVLNPREREILEQRQLKDKPKKLEELSKKFNISRERVRQIEVKAFEKVQKEISNIT